MPARLEHAELVRQLALAQGVKHAVHVVQLIDVALSLVVEKNSGSQVADALLVPGTAVGCYGEAHARRNGDCHGAKAARTPGDE